MNIMQILILTLPLLLSADINGKRVYGDNNIEKKLEKYSRHNENPLGKKDSKCKILKETHAKLNNLKIDMKKERIRKVQYTTKNQVDFILNHRKKSNKKKYKHKKY